MSKRNFGLDVIRSLAIIQILICHFISFILPFIYKREFWAIISDYILRMASFTFGILGVELFFVLSGFLIGSILIKAYNSNSINIAKFYIRRWFRTLPLYYLALLINLLIFFSINKPDLSNFLFSLKYFIFCQNFDENFSVMNFFTESWSLSVEEWFYLLLPNIFLMFSFFKIKKENLYKIIIALIIFIILAKASYLNYFGNGFDFDFNIRRNIPLRFDSLLVGVLFACLKINNLRFYNSFANFKYIILSFFTLLALMLYINFLYINNLLENAYFIKNYSLIIISFCLGAIICFFENNKYINNKLKENFYIKNFFENLSLYSYSIYLFNLSIYSIFKGFYVNLQITIIFLIITTILIIAISHFIYKYYEKPIMDLRDKF